MQPLEVWGGAECSLVRVGDDYRDETHETGHHARLDDLDRMAALGIRTVRLPILWETVAGGEAAAGWAWHDARIDRARRLGIAPVAGLLHHGSGPPDTSLLDPAFPERLAAHAAAVAARYPDIRHYTPVNEPLTTARFSALYGHWYPHARCEAAFLRALVAECRATLLAMRAIRAVRPDAVLVQTEDLGRTFSTPKLADQAGHDNDRRWLTFDLLLGRVDRAHPFHGRILSAGVEADDLALLATGEGAPDILGLNHYLTSDRYLDERLGRYPPDTWGGNAREAYADVEAVRADLPAHALGPLARLRETWDRYRRPIAITEVSHGCARDEQLRWLLEVWAAAVTARGEGVDVRAVTPWALFGSVDWRTLLTRRDGHYEPGAFDIRGPAPRPTALARAIHGLATAGAWDHPVLDGCRWWRRPDRLFAPPRVQAPARVTPDARHLLLVGAGDHVRDGIRHIAAERGLPHDVLDAETLARAGRGWSACLSDRRAWAVVATDAGARAVGLAEACAAAGLPFAVVSRAGASGGTDGPALAEHVSGGIEAAVLAVHPGALVARVEFLFGPWAPAGTVEAALAAEGRAAHRAVSISYLPDVAHALLDLLVDGERGVWHLVNRPDDLADPLRALAAAAGIGSARLRPAGAPPPGTRDTLLPSARSAIAHFAAGRGREALAAAAH